MQYAIIELAGKQYRVYPGLKFIVDRLDSEEGSELTINEVLLTGDDEKDAKTSTKIGDPYIKGAKVVLTIGEHSKGDKLRVATYKSKSRYRKVTGHRQRQTSVEVKSLTV